MNSQLALFNKDFESRKYLSFVLPIARLEIKFRPLPIIEKAGKDELPTYITNMVLNSMKSGGDPSAIQPSDFSREDLYQTLIRATGFMKELACQPLTDEEAEGRVDEAGYALDDLHKNGRVLQPLKVLEFSPETPFTDEQIMSIREPDRLAWFTYVIEQSLQTATETGQTVTSEELGRFPEQAIASKGAKRKADRADV